MVLSLCLFILYQKLLEMNIAIGTADAQRYAFVTGSGNQCHASTINKYISKSWEESGARHSTGKKFTATTNRKEHTTIGRRYEPQLADEIAKQLGHRRDTADRYYATDIKRRQSPCTVNRLRMILEGPDEDVDAEMGAADNCTDPLTSVGVKSTTDDDVPTTSTSTDGINNGKDYTEETSTRLSISNASKSPLLNRRFSQDITEEIAAVFCEDIQYFIAKGKKPAMATIKRKRVLLNACSNIVSNQQIRDKVVTIGKQQIKKNNQ